MHCQKRIGFETLYDVLELNKCMLSNFIQKKITSSASFCMFLDFTTTCLINDQTYSLPGGPPQAENQTVPTDKEVIVKKTTTTFVKDITEEEITEEEKDSIKKEVKIIRKIVKKESGEPPRFTKPISPQVVRESQDCVFKGLVSGAPQPEISWLKDKQEIKPDGQRIMTIFNKDIGECQLIIKNSQPEDVGVYSCRASNPAGKATCTANVVIVREYFSIIYIFHLFNFFIIKNEK